VNSAKTELRKIRGHPIRLQSATDDTDADELSNLP